jgi:hypothetical protein
LSLILKILHHYILHILQYLTVRNYIFNFPPVERVLCTYGSTAVRSFAWHCWMNGFYQKNFFPNNSIKNSEFAHLLHFWVNYFAKK